MVGDVARRWPAAIRVAIGGGLLAATITACGNASGLSPSPNTSDGITLAASNASPAAQQRGSSAATGAPSSLQAGTIGVPQQGTWNTAGPATTRTGTTGPAMKVGGDPVPPPSASIVAPIAEKPSISGPVSASPTPSQSQSSSSPPGEGTKPNPSPDPSPVTPPPQGTG